MKKDNTTMLAICIITGTTIGIIARHIGIGMLLGVMMALVTEYFSNNGCANIKNDNDTDDVVINEDNEE